MKKLFVSLLAFAALGLYYPSEAFAVCYCKNNTNSADCACKLGLSCPSGYTKVSTCSTAPTVSDGGGTGSSSLGTGSYVGVFFSDFPVSPNFTGVLPKTFLTCEQAGVPCPDTLPTVKFTGELTFKKGQVNTITRNQGGDWVADSGFPSTTPYAIQVVGSGSNDGLNKVLSVTGSVLTVSGVKKNETTTATVGVADVVVEFTGNPNAPIPPPATVYARLFNDNGTPKPPSDTSTYITQDGVGAFSGFINATRECKSDGDNFKLPCSFTAFVGSGQAGTLEFFAPPVGGNPSNNFDDCEGQTLSQRCGQLWSDPSKITGGVIKKFFPATADLLQGQSFFAELTEGAGYASTIRHRACNTPLMISTLDPTTAVFNCDFLTATVTRALVPAPMQANPNPLNVSSASNVLSINIDNKAGVNTSLLAPVTPDSVVIVFRSPQGGTERVFNTGNPTFNPTSAVFKFIREQVLCAANRAGVNIEDGVDVILNMEGTFPSTGGGLYGDPWVTINGTFDANVCASSP